MVKTKIDINNQDVAIFQKDYNSFIKDDKSRLQRHVVAYIDFLGTTDKISSDEQLNFLKKIKYIYNKTALIYKNQQQNLNKELYNKIQKRKNTYNFQYNNLVNSVIKYKIFSDNIILAIQIPTKEPDIIKTYTWDLYSRMISICAQFQAIAFFYGLPLRGGITVGDLYLNKSFVYGDALLESYKMENLLANYPRIIINKDYINPYLKKNKGFVKDIDGSYFVDYYEQLGLSNYVTESMANHAKNELLKWKNRTEKPKDMQKVEWAIDYHNKYLKKHSTELNYLLNYLIESN